MKYKDIVNKLNHMHDDGYFNNHYSKETHDTSGSFNTTPFYTIGTCECASCIAHALAFGMRGHYKEIMITEEILEELKSIYGIEELINAVKEEAKATLLPFFETGGTRNLESEA